jgi:chromosome segregation protein
MRQEAFILLKLKRLELLGFKSFADRTRLEFPEGTVGVVGPNGCGKSNLSDAINWVLGEQSARTLRGERMTDVIFNGTGTRPPTGMAEVSLTLEDPEYAEPAEENREEYFHADLPDNSASDQDGSAHPGGNGSSHRAHLKSGSGRITVSRRLFRSGESEYLINGRPCRLRDIQDVFLGTGLGPESYAIIEQGRIGQILSSKPSDRRLILEEAAGISKFKTRKRAAELKLESARGNLSRIADILEEVIKQVNSLKRQASKARRFHELHEEMLGRQKVVLASRLRALEAQCGELRQEFERLHLTCSETGRRLGDLEQDQISTTARLEEIERELTSLRDALSENELARERAQSRLEQIEQQKAALDSRSAEASQESEQLQTRVEALREEARLQAEENDRLAAERNAAEQAAAKLHEQQEELGSRIRDRERAIEQARQALLAALSRGAELRNQLVQAEEMTLALDRQETRAGSEQAGVESERQRLAAELESLSAGNERIQSEAAQLAEAVSQTAATLERVQKEEVSKRNELEDRRRELSGMEARKQTLEESLARHAYSTESVRRLLNGEIPSNGHAFRPLGVLADFLEVSPGYEEIVEEFLKAELDCVVVAEHQEARSGIALLQAEGTGRSTFFVTRMAASAHSNGNGAVELSQESGVVAPLQDMVRFEPRLGLNGDQPLDSLGKAYVVENASAAERLAAGYPEYHFLTPSGEHYHHRLVSGGRGSNAGPLALRRDFRELERRTIEVESSIKAGQAQLAEIESLGVKTREELGKLSAARQDCEKNLVVGAERLRQTQEALNRTLERLRLLAEEGARLTKERETLQTRQASLRAQLEAEGGEKSRWEAETAAYTQEVSEWRAQFDEGSQNLARAQAHLSALEERTRAQESERSRLDSQLQETSGRLDRLALQIKGWNEEQQQLALEAEALATQRAQVEINLTGLKEKSLHITGELQIVRARREELRPQVEAARARYEADREKRSEVEVSLARAESDRDHHAQQCREALEREPETLLEELTEEAALSGEALEAAENEVRELKKRIDNLGPLNMMALEELKEAEERYEFLESQRQDLFSSIEDTTEAIREIDRLSRQQFLEAYRAINVFFAELFRTLFGGGTGQLRLNDEEDADSGLDIVAQPPGKRLQNVLLLSGGEKALAAIALLMAIFRYTPSPFCVLDEVDAPLDDSNVERFTRLIHQMSRTSQFILITHNKRTMEISSAIYGVTMEEPGVSKLVSVKFEEVPEPVAVPA